MTLRIHILGASGSGTTTLGQALARALGCAHHDTDQHFWAPSDPPYTTRRPVAERLAGLGRALDATDAWTLSGSLVGWGDPLIPRFTHVVYLSLPCALRMQRLRRRERARHGARVAPGGDLRAQHLEFMAWASRYDTAGLEQRSRQSHEAWLGACPCPILRLTRPRPTDAQVVRVLAACRAAPG